MIDGLSTKDPNQTQREASNRVNWVEQKAESLGGRQSNSEDGQNSGSELGVPVKRVFFTTLKIFFVFLVRLNVSGTVPDALEKSQQVEQSDDGRTER